MIKTDNFDNGEFLQPSIDEILGLTALVSENLDIQIIKKSVVNGLKLLLNSQAATLYFWDEEFQRLRFDVVDGEKGNIIKSLSVPKGQGISGWVAENRKSIIVNDPQNDKRFFKIADIKSGFNTKNMICVPIVSKGEFIGVLQVLNKMDGDYSQDDLKLLQGLASNIGMAIVNAQMHENLQKAHIDLQNTILASSAALAEAIGLRDNYTGGHTQRTVNYSIQIGKSLEFSEKMLHVLEWSARLHDIGKVGIDDSILRKEGPLTDEEFNIMQKHPLLGADLIRNLNFLEEMIPGIEQHHERIDGKGYPNKLVGSKISIYGRIIAVVDAYDAMITDRPYRKGMPINKAIIQIIKGKGSQFDEMIVDIFLNILSKKYQDEYKLAIENI